MFVPDCSPVYIVRCKSPSRYGMPLEDGKYLSLIKRVAAPGSSSRPGQKEAGRVLVVQVVVRQ